MKKITLCFGSLLLFLTANAGIMIHPKYVLLNDKTKTAEIMLANSSETDSANYRVSVSYKKQNSDGSYTDFEPEDPLPPQSAVHLLRFSPRSVLLAPGQSQMVRILRRFPEDLAAGEYTAYITFTEVVLEKPRTKENLADGTFTVKLTPIPSFSIPVIVRHNVKEISSATLSVTGIEEREGKLFMRVVLQRQPSDIPTSIRGDISIWLDGKQVGLLRGKYLLLGNDSVDSLIPLHTQDKTYLSKKELKGKTLDVLFTKQSEDKVDKKNVICQTQFKF